MLRLLAATGAALALLPSAAPAARAPALKAGAAAVDITPPTTSPMFAYTSRSMIFGPGPDVLTDRVAQMASDPDTGIYAKTFRAGQGVHTRILTRALAFERAGRRYALVQADLGGLPYALTQEVARRIAGTGVTAERLMLSATHTHSSTGAIWPADNSGYAFVGGDAFDPRIFELTAQGIADAVRRAVARLEPARAGFAAVEQRGASNNRSFEAFRLNEDVPADEQAARLASTDPTFTVLRVDAADGRPIAAWSNFAAHPTTLDEGIRLFSGDTAGAAARWAERAMTGDYAARTGRAPVPAPVEVWTNGAEGDVSSNGGPTAVAPNEPVQYVRSDAASADLGGRRQAEGIVEAWRAAGRSLSDDLPIVAERTLVKFDGTPYGPDGGPKEPVGPFPVLGMGVVSENQCAPVDGMAGPGQGPKAPLVGGAGIAPDTHPVSFWRLGGLGVVSFPAEINKQMGQRIRDDLLARAGGRLGYVALAGLTNGYISYTSTPEEYDSCDYEASFTLYGRQMGYAWLAFGRALEKAALDGGEVASAPEPPALGFGTAQTTPARPTPDAGTATAQPDPSLTRYGRAVLKWRGGDQQIDFRRGKPFVSLQRRVGRGFTTVATDDSLSDTTRRADGEWTETWQFDECATPGIYRLRVTGRAVTVPGGDPAPYVVRSREFTVSPVTLAVPPPAVADGVASVRPLYPDPGAGALLALPRLLLGGQVDVLVGGGGRIPATDPDGDGLYTAEVGGATVLGAAATDRCGNTGRSG